MKDFEKFAKSMGISGSVITDVRKAVNSTITPVVLEERELRCTSVDVFSRLMLDRRLFFGSYFTEDACNTVIAQLLYLDSTGEGDIQIMINSPGGAVVDGLAVIDTINYVHCDVSTLAVGMAASMGATLLASGTVGKRFVLPHSRVMIHQVSSGISGKMTDMAIEFEQTKRCEKDIYNILAKQMNKSYDEIVALCKDDNWFIGQEAVEIGIADKVITRD